MSNGMWHKIANIKSANFFPQANPPNITPTNKSSCTVFLFIHSTTCTCTNAVVYITECTFYTFLSLSLLFSRSGLHYASASGHAEVLKELLKNGAERDKPSSSSDSYVKLSLSFFHTYLSLSLSFHIYLSFSHLVLYI